MNDKLNCFLCFYCGKQVALSELKNVDFELSVLDEEDKEFLLDQLEIYNNKENTLFDSNFKFRHEPNQKTTHSHVKFGQLVNICQECYRKAFHKNFSE